MAQDWDIKPRGETCGACEQPFADHQPYVSALVHDENGYVRRDFCANCWQTAQAHVEPFSAWHGIFRMPPPPPEEPLRKETAESLLRKLMEEDDPARQNVIYILAVMLERKRVLVERSVEGRADGTLMRIYEHRKTGETFLIPDPGLRLEQIESVQEEVALLLGAKPRGASKDEATPPERDEADEEDGEANEG